MKKMKRLREKIELNENESHLAKSQSFEENVNHKRRLNNFFNADKLSTEKTNHKYLKNKVRDCKQRIIA